MLLAVATMHEAFTVLQAFGSILMLGGSFATQRNSTKRAVKQTPAPVGEEPLPKEPPKPIFVPQLFSGYLFGLGAACCYGASPLMARQAFLHAPHASTSAGGCIAYGSAICLFALTLLRPSAWRDVSKMKRENMGWFLSSAVLVAVSQAFVYASLAVAPLMVVTPILQLSLIFRLFLSQWLNRAHEVLNLSVIVGAATAVAGSILVSLDTSYLAVALKLPGALGHLLSYRLAGA
jgi:drug/metabolite transporter (DMT)-like permease